MYVNILFQILIYEWGGSYLGFRIFGIFAKLITPWGWGRWIIFTKTPRKSTNWIKGFVEHQIFLFSDKYEQSYSLLKSVENPDFPGSGSELYASEEHFLQICRGKWNFCVIFFIPSSFELGAKNLNLAIKIYVICAEIEKIMLGRCWNSIFVIFIF